MKTVNSFITSILLCVGLCASSWGQTAQLAEGQLSIYGIPTQIGTVARRTFRDSSGRVIREIFYTLKKDVPQPPYTKDMLEVQSTVLYDYDERGYKIRAEHYDARMILDQVWETRYYENKEKREIKSTPDGVRQYEIRYLDDRTVSHLYYDERGKNLVAVRGLIPRDIDLPFGWGEPVDGLACGIALTQTKSLVDELPCYAIYVNVKNSGSNQASLSGLPAVQIELRDRFGVLVREIAAEANKGRDPLQAHRLLYGQLINPGESGYVYPPYELSIRSTNLRPGRYSLRVRQPIEGRNQSLVSNTVFFEVEGRNN